MIKSRRLTSHSVRCRTWRLKDLCYSPTIPSFDIQYIEQVSPFRFGDRWRRAQLIFGFVFPLQIFENIFPCAIITPLDCFWEGSKLLGPEFPVTVP